jgi:arginyl-tRNA synthetase
MTRNAIQTLIEAALGAAQASGALPAAELPEIVVEQPQRADHGDFATPVALTLAKPMRRAPREIAQAIVAHLPASELVAAVEIAGPGYVNIRLRPDWLAGQVDRVLAAGPRYADQDLGTGRRAQVEFISANPTGPLTVGHARNAVLGDTLANVLAATGWQVTREYYFNDGGLQMKNLAESLRLRVRQELGETVEFPETYYQGEYICEIARDLLRQHGAEIVQRDWTFLRDRAVEAIFADIRRTQERLGVHFDIYTNEASFYESGAIWQVLERLREQGQIYEAEGAVWFRATSYGADKDRVLVRSTGEPTYRLPDIAYHVDKLERGFDLIVDVLGADHIAAVPDIVSAVRALGYDADRIRPLVYQFVTLIRQGELVKMSTRKAEYVTLDELLDEVGADAVRFFLLMRSSDAPIEFDLDLAKRRSEDNPVYYVQYAHARCCSILRKAAQQGMGDGGWELEPELAPNPHPLTSIPHLLDHPAELALIKEILRLGDVLSGCAERLELHPLTFYARDLASAFAIFYDKCPVLTAPDRALVGARLKLVKAAQIALARVLDLMGMQAPESM